MDPKPAHDEVFIHSITGIILENLHDENFSANELVRSSGLTRYRLNKKLQSLTGKNINQFIRETRLARSKEMLLEGNLTISEVAFKTGFGSPAYFSKCFRDFYGYSPGQAKTVSDASAREKQVEKAGKQTDISIFLIVAVVVTAAIFFLPGILTKEKTSSGKAGVAVMPFENLTGNQNWDYWQRAIQRDLISALALSGEIEVRDEFSIDTLLKKFRSIESSVTGSSARIVSRKVQAEYYITGSIQEFENKIRLDAHLVRTSSGVLLKPFEVTDTYSGENTLLLLIDTLRKRITDYLIVRNIITKNLYFQHLFTTPRSAEAMRYYDYAFKSFAPADKIRWLKKALAADSGFYSAAVDLEYAYSANLQKDSSRIWLIKNFSDRYKMSEPDRLKAGWAYSFTFESPDEQINYLSGLSKIDEQDPSIHYLIGLTYCLDGNYSRAVPELEKSLKILDRWGPEFLKDPGNWRNFKWLGIAYHNTGEYEKEKKLYRKAAAYMAGDPWLAIMNALVALSENDMIEFDRHLKIAEANYLKDTLTNAGIKVKIGRYFEHAAIFDISEKYFREALSLEPENFALLDLFAEFCRQSGRYNDPEIMEKGMNLSPDKHSYFDFLAMKGMCLFSCGKKDEGRKLIHKALNEAPFKTFMLKDFFRKTAPL